VRATKPVVGSARLSKPPHDAPMPNSASASTNACELSTEKDGLNSTPNSEHAPVKSRFQISWPGAPGSAGCSTRATSGRAASQCATARPDFSCCSSRTPIVRMPRKVSQQSSGLAYWPSARDPACSVSQSASLFTVTLPIRMSECPAGYFVTAWIETSTPWRNGWK